MQEIRRVACRLAQHHIQPADVIAWSLWRRAHQAAAQEAHIRSKLHPRSTRPGRRLRAAAAAVPLRRCAGNHLRRRAPPCSLMVVTSIRSNKVSPVRRCRRAPARPPRPAGGPSGARAGPRPLPGSPARGPARRRCHAAGAAGRRSRGAPRTSVPLTRASDAPRTADSAPPAGSPWSARRTRPEPGRRRPGVASARS